MNGRALVARNLRRLRIERGVSQERLAADSGVDRAYLSGVERETENPTVDLLDRLSATLAVPVSALFAECSHDQSEPTPLPRGRRPKAS